MDNPYIEPMQPHEASRYDTWFNDGGAVMTGGSSTSPRSAAMYWKTVWRGEVIAIAKVAVDKNIGYLNIATRSDMRRRGIGSNTIAALLNQPEIKQLRELRSRAQSSNTAAQRTLMKNGFSKLGFSPEGLVEYSHRLI